MIGRLFLWLGIKLNCYTPQVLHVSDVGRVRARFSVRDGTTFYSQWFEGSARWCDWFDNGGFAVWERGEDMFREWLKLHKDHGFIRDGDRLVPIHEIVAVKLEHEPFEVAVLSE